ncbi:hypothetical protein TWF281_000065 [Arthrobotrys megalospora]
MKPIVRAPESILRTRLTHFSATVNVRRAFGYSTVRTVCGAFKPQAGAPGTPASPTVSLNFKTLDQTRVSRLQPHRQMQSVAARVEDAELENIPIVAVATASAPARPAYVPQFSNLAERLIDDFKAVDINFTQTGAQTIKLLFSDLPDQSITSDLVNVMDARLREYERNLKANGEDIFKVWTPANESHTCGARFRTDSLRKLEKHPRGMWEALEEDIRQFHYDHWGMKVYWFMVELIKADIIAKREVEEFHGTPEEEEGWGLKPRWRRLL